MTCVRLILLFSLVGFMTPHGLWAEVVRVIIDERVDVLGGRPFGSGGAYRRIFHTHSARCSWAW